MAQHIILRCVLLRYVTLWLPPNYSYYAPVKPHTHTHTRTKLEWNWNWQVNNAFAKLSKFETLLLQLLH